MIAVTSGAAESPGVGRLDEQPDPAGEHVLGVQRALVGDRVGDLRAQVGMAFDERPPERLVAADQVEYLGRERAVPRDQVRGHGGGTS